MQLRETIPVTEYEEVEGKDGQVNDDGPDNEAQHSSQEVLHYGFLGG